MSNNVGTRASGHVRLFSSLLLALWFFTNATLFTTTALAQTEFEIASKQANLEREYREELDNWMLRAYEGDPEAQFKVGVLFTNSQFGKADFEQAVYWYKQAARQDHVMAQYNLGHQYLTGIGVAKNVGTAMEWWLRAADKDHALAQFNVGRAYYLGIGLEKDHKKSRNWFERAALNQEPKSIEILQQLGWYDEERFKAAAVVADKEPSRKQDSSEPQTPEQAPTNQQLAKAQVPNVLQMPNAQQSTTPRAELQEPEDSGDVATPLKSRITGVSDTAKQQDVTPAVVPQAEAVTSGTANKPARAEQELEQEQEPLQTSRAYIPPPVIEIEVKRRPPADQADSATELAKTTQVVNDTSSLGDAPSTKTTTEQASADSKQAATKQRPNNSDKNGLRAAPVALYTNPKVRSVLITIARNRQELSILERGPNWSSVQSSSGFPVWVHSDFIEASESLGTVTGQAVNARSVPIITHGTVVGKLAQGENVHLIDQRQGWYRVQSPARFKAWVKTEDFDRLIDEETYTVSDRNKPNGWATRQQVAPADTTKVEPAASKPTASVPTESTIAKSPAQTADAKALEPQKTSETPRSSSSSTRPENDNAWLFAQPADSYTLQLASFDDPLKVQEFVSRSKFINNPALHRFRASGKDIQWTYFLYGSYPQKDSAEQARVSINQKMAWVRTFGRLQQNRCVAWKTQFPTPRELNKYCKQ